MLPLLAEVKVGRPLVRPRTLPGAVRAVKFGSRDP